MLQYTTWLNTAKLQVILDVWNENPRCFLGWDTVKLMIHHFSEKLEPFQLGSRRLQPLHINKCRETPQEAWLQPNQKKMRKESSAVLCCQNNHPTVCRHFDRLSHLELQIRPGASCAGVKVIERKKRPQAFKLQYSSLCSDSIWLTVVSFSISFSLWKSCTGPEDH